MKPANATQEFIALALRHEPAEAAVGGLYAAAMAYCFTNETVTEALDAMRADIPSIEHMIRGLFSQVADIKNARDQAEKRVSQSRSL